MIGFRPTVEQVVRELKLLGFSDIRKVVSWRNELVTRTEKAEDGEPVMVMMPRVTIVDADKISDEAAAAVAEVWQTVNGALRVKLHDKHAALVSIGKHLGGRKRGRSRDHARKIKPHARSPGPQRRPAQPGPQRSLRSEAESS